MHPANGGPQSAQKVKKPQKGFHHQIRLFPVWVHPHTIVLRRCRLPFVRNLLGRMYDECGVTSVGAARSFSPLPAPRAFKEPLLPPRKQKGGKKKGGKQKS